MEDLYPFDCYNGDDENEYWDDEDSAVGVNDGVFRWKTMEGDLLTLPEMDTKHCFNSMKMIFNHIAQAWGGKPVWFTKQYGDYVERCTKDPVEQARYVVLFLEEIERRGDLPDRYQDPYRQIKEQIMPIQKRIQSETKLLTGR